LLGACYYEKCFKYKKEALNPPFQIFLLLFNANNITLKLQKNKY
jgi:hypothetical protein